VKLGDVSISSEHPSTEQISAALAALGAEPVMDPDMRPEGPRDEDRLLLLGHLLAKVELEITAATSSAEEENVEDLLDTLLGWAGQIGPDPGTAANVLTNRLQLTAVQVSQTEAEEVPPGRNAAFAAVTTAVYALSAQLHAERGDAQGTRQALGEAEECLIDILQGMHDLRVVLGDARPVPEE
jgi:hypothetical protein